VRILTTANHLDAAGGLERTHLTNAQGLARRGHRLDLVYVVEGAFADSWRDLSVTMTRVPTTLPRRAHPLHSARNVTEAVRAARRLEPDIVYVYRYWDLPFAVAVAAGRPTAVVYHLCLPPPERLPRWLQAVLARVDTTISVSEHTLGLWRGTGLRIDHAVVALTSVDLETYAPGSATRREATRRELGIATEDRVIFFGGRIAPEKGVDVLVRAFRKVVEKAGPRCRLIVLGSPSASADPVESSRYVDELHKLGEGLPVTWLPRRDNVVSLLQAADVASVPSLWPEPLSRSIMEALGCGTPVVATSVGGSPEILTGWMSSLLAEPGDSDDLARHLLDVLDWRERNGDLGPRCRRAAEERLSLSDEIDLIEGAMLSALDRRRA
jgi:glycosyltransferase involved in cell wall biosynthesis